MPSRDARDHGFFSVNNAKQKALQESGWMIGVGIGYGGFFSGLKDCLDKIHVTSGGYPKSQLRMDNAMNKMRSIFSAAHKKGGRVIFIGNGGSAAIASHLAVDYTKNAGIRSIAFNDSATITCMANDFGYQQTFAKQLEYYATKKDIAVLISSSGKSQNIINAAKQAMDMDMDIITLTGMLDDNPLRGLGEINFYVPSCDYGLVEITHLSILHTLTCVVSANL